MLSFARRFGVWAAVLVAAMFAYAFSALAPLPPQNPKAFGSIKGYVATVLSPQIQIVERRVGRNQLTGPQSISLGQPIFLPDINVVARNERGGFVSATAVTNPEGYFLITGLPEGTYQLCVSGTGYISGCDSHNIGVGNPWPVVLDHILNIQPSGNPVAGTVWLADLATPCFWFRPALDPKPLIARVSLLDANKKVVAGPVTGNNLGQYVIPTSLPNGGGNLHAECDAGIADTAVPSQAGPLVQDVAINNHPPQILAMDFTQGSAGVRRVNPGDTVRVTVQVGDLDGDPLHYRWADDTGVSLGLPDAPSVDWKVVNAVTLNRLHVQVSDGRGGVATLTRALPSGPDSLLFAGRVFNRQTLTAVNNAVISLNNVTTKTDANGNFRISVPDAPNFVLNVNKPGFALSSQVLRTPATNIDIPFDVAQTSTINAARGGSIQLPPPGCQCVCPSHRGGHEEKEGDHDRDVDDRDKDDRDKDDRNRDNTRRATCKGTTAGTGLSLQFPAGALVTTSGAAFSGNVSVEALQYDLNQTNPIPGDFGAIYQGKAVRMASFGAFHVAVRDAQGHSLKMAPNKKVSVTVPIQTAQLASAPAVIPFFRYDETKGTWLEDGILTRSGNHYVGHIAHFSAFNADTVFPGGACVKVVLDNTFTFPVTLSAVYLDPSSGTFNHNGTQSNDLVIGVERMTPNVNFNLTITDSNNATVSVPLFSGPGLDPIQFPGGLDTDQVNFSHCNGPVQISNNATPATKPYFLGEVFGGTITDTSAQYQQATQATPGGTRDTLDHWKNVNGFFNPPTNEATATYFNNGDLKFGRDMHCRETNTTTHALACYVSNFGIVGTDDALAAVPAAEQYEASGQITPQPAATVCMEYDPTTPANAVQFWAYHGEVLGSPINIASISRSGNVVTVITQSAQSLSTGYLVGIAGVAGGTTSFNGTFHVANFVDGTHFTYSQTGPNESGTNGTGTAAPGDGGLYFHNPALDSQGPKTMPDICIGCHQGSYSGSTTTGVAGAVFLPFDLDSFKDDTNQFLPAHPPSAAVQTQFHTLNNMIANTAPPSALSQLINQVWYANNTPSTPFTFNQGAQQLPATPAGSAFLDSANHNHDPLYDNVVKEVCRTCHVAINGLPWNRYDEMESLQTTIQTFACAPSMKMPNAEVPWINYWQNNRNATLDSELGFSGNGCPNH